MLTSLLSLFRPKANSQQLTAISSRVDDSSGWTSLTNQPHDYNPAQVQELYQDALTAWRKNPIAWRIIAITTDYIVGDAFSLSSKNRSLNRFISAFWHHPKNRLDLRLETMCDELSRSGDLFILLFRNEQDGMSYIRFVTKDQIIRIETAPNDWETEIAYYELKPTGEQARWLSPDHPAADLAPAVMLHYSINRPAGALLGESDLTTMLPWLQRYSRMLEDRVRLHWAVRSFLWLVTVPVNKIQEKREQYRIPPDTGSIVIKDEMEKWEAITPTLHGSDASRDLQAVRGMIDAGSGYPPHWRGEAADANLATATAMQGPTERHLLRRQQYFTFMLQDIIYHAYQRALQLTYVRPLPTADYTLLFQTILPDISRSDNESLARAARDISQALETASHFLPQSETGNQKSQIHHPTFSRLALQEIFKFAGDPQPDAALDAILTETLPPTDPRSNDVSRSPTDPRSNDVNRSPTDPRSNDVSRSPTDPRSNDVSRSPR